MNQETQLVSAFHNGTRHILSASCHVIYRRSQKIIIRVIRVQL